MFVAARVGRADSVNGRKQTTSDATPKTAMIPRDDRREMVFASATTQWVYLSTTTVRFVSVKTENVVPAGITAERPFLVAPIPNVRTPSAAACP